jgi:antitoxin (DNA-binding transcriptional repressor) of toxin-antitoxin stability system
MGAQICLGQLRSDTCGFIDRVSAGETLEIIRRGKLVALIVPDLSFPHQPPNGDERIDVEDRGPDANILLTHLRKNAATYFDRVAAGEIIGIVHHGRLIARILAATRGRGQHSSIPRREGG